MCEFDIRLSDITGGSVMNVIPKKAEAIFFVPEFQAEDMVDKFNDILNSLKDKNPEEKEMKISLMPLQKNEHEVVMSYYTQVNLLELLNQLPHGPQSYEEDGSVQSSNNLAIVCNIDGIIEVHCMFRSSNEKSMDELEELILGLYAKFGAACKKDTKDRYPAWEPNFQTKIAEKCKNIFVGMFGFEPVFENIHAGLECSAFYKLMPEKEYISFGPTMEHVHTPIEQLDINSVEAFYNFLKTLLSSYTVN